VIALAPNRSCEGCTLCCKLMAIKELNKPRLAECSHCDVGVGCKIYENRPHECGEFYCSYRLDANLGEEWRPSICKIVISYDPAAHRINVCVDPSIGADWRKPPFYERIKAMALDILNRRGHLIVWEGANGIGILPHADVFLGPPQPNQVIVAGRTMTEHGAEFMIMVMDRNDPRIAPA
jgi:hypothetical protein